MPCYHRQMCVHEMNLSIRHCGFISDISLRKKIENYMLTTISSVMHATVKDSENRMARAMYKLAVETSKLSHVIAYSHGVDEQALGKLQAKCAEEVKRINGAVRFEEAYQYQQGDRF